VSFEQCPDGPFVLRVGKTTSKVPGRTTASRHATLRTAQHLHERFAIADTGMMRNMYKFVDGVAPVGISAGTRRLSEKYLAATSRRRAIPHHRGETRPLTEVRVGACWSGDWTPRLPMSLGGNQYAMTWCEEDPDSVVVILAKEKTTRTFLDTLETLQDIVAATHPGTSIEHLFLDRDATWFSTSVPSPLAKTEATKEFAGWLRRHPMDVDFTPAESQALNPAEGSAEQLFYAINFFLLQASLSMEAWEDTLSAAELVVNMLPRPQSKHVRAREASRYEMFHGRRPDGSALIAAPGQTVFIHVHGSKANMGNVKAFAGYMVRPTRTFQGWLVRRLHDKKLLVARHVTVINDLHVRAARLAASDTLYRPGGGGVLGGHAKVVHEQIRRLFVAKPAGASTACSSSRTR